MKKTLKTALISMLTATALISGSAATLVLSSGAETTASAENASTFYMVDGASIRTKDSYGIRFIAEMKEDITQKADIVEAGILIAPYRYINDSNCYTDGKVGNYQNLTTKQILKAYDTVADDDGTVNKIYATNGNWRMNGALVNVKLENYTNEFIGIGYWKDKNGAYTFADFEKEDNVRTTTYVAIEAYEYETDLTDAQRTVIENYVLGAQLKEVCGMTETIYGESAPYTYEYTYGETTYNTIAEVATAAGKGNWQVALNESSMWLLESGKTAQLAATISDGGDKVDFAGVHAVWRTSDKKVATVDNNGVVTAVGCGTATITAIFMGASATCTINVVDGTFENTTAVPAYMTKANNTKELLIAETDGDKALEIKLTDTGTAPAMDVTVDFLAAFFADESVDYIAFDAKAGVSRTQTFKKYGAKPSYEDTIEYLGLYSDAYKSFYFSRADYNQWVTDGKTSEKFINVAGMTAGDSIYVDNIRAVTEEEYVADIYSLESGGVRDNGNNKLFYIPTNNGGVNTSGVAVTNQWQWGIMPGAALTAAGYTNELVSDGMRAYSFTPVANTTTTIQFNTGATPTDAENAILNETGYYAFDLYIPAGANTTLTYTTTNYPGVTPKAGGWTTVYVSTSKVFVKIQDTTGSTYVIDNIRSVTEEEYDLATLSFEAGTGGIRNTESDVNGVARYYGGADHAANKWSITLQGRDAGAVSGSRFASDIVHSGAYSFAFKKSGNQVDFHLGTNSEAYSLLKDGFSFWIYSTVAINGNNFVVDGFAKLFNGANIAIPAGTWTKLTIQPENINASGRFLILQGSSWSGDIYLDDFMPLTSYTVTYNANGGSVTNETQSVYYDNAYTLETPTAPNLTQEFLGWQDENGNYVDLTGVWSFDRNVTLTAVYSNAGKVSFESGNVPTYITGSYIESFSIVDDTTKDGKVLKAKTTASSTNDTALYIKTEALGAFFADESAAYFAFDVMTDSADVTGATAGLYDVYYHDYTSGSGKWLRYDASGHTQYNYIPNDAFKTYYLSREVYQSWVDNNLESARFIMAGANAKVFGGASFYIDNLRSITAEEYANSHYSFERGNLRNGSTEFFYYSGVSNPWELKIDNLGTASFTNSNVSEGGRAWSFTKKSGSSSFYFNHTADTVMETAMRSAGYVSFDLYVPEGSDATYQIGTYTNAPLKKGAWTTIYVQVDATNNTLFTLTDTTGSTYVIDNFCLLTEEEYQAAALGFEAGTGGLNIDSVDAYYYVGVDHTANKTSISIDGRYTSDWTTAAKVENARLDGSNAHSGDYSLAFEKTDGQLDLYVQTSSTAYTLLKDGFTFWLYSTVSINGKGTANFNNGNNTKLNGGAGQNISANVWTKVTISASDFAASGRFMIISGSTAGTFYIDDIAPLSDVEEEEIVLEYKTTVEEDADGVKSGVLLKTSTHTGGTNALPLSADDTEDMSYIRFNGTYGLNDYLVFDFTGDNIPFISFFNSDVTNTIFNQDEDESVKGWIVANGITVNSGVLYGGIEGAHANRLAVLGPNKISATYDGNGGALDQKRLNEGSAASPSPIAMYPLQSVTAQYRMIIGWIANGSYMNLRICVIDLTTGQQVVNYNLDGTFAVAEEGDIALHGHFGRDTYIDKLYPIEEDTDIDELIKKYTPSVVVYNGDWSDGDTLTLDASSYTHTSGATSATGSCTPETTDMSYIAFNGSYGLNDYVVFDFTGDNMPFISFFDNNVGSAYQLGDTTAQGWVWANGLYKGNGEVYGGESAVHWKRAVLFGQNKIQNYDSSTGRIGGPWADHALSIYSLQGVNDTYRMIFGYADRNGSSVFIQIYVMNMVTGEVVFNQTTETVWAYPSGEGSIALYGQFGKTTVLDKVFGVEENTTLEALIEKYGKDSDYSDEEAVTLDRYAYSSLSDGTWLLDGSVSETYTNYQADIAYYNTYKNAGFNILFPQMNINVESSDFLTYMDLAHQAGLKVILQDARIQNLSEPITVTSTGTTGTAWTIGNGGTYGTTASLDAVIAGYISAYKDHPAFYGVMLGDEPSYHNAYCYGEVYKSLKRLMPDMYVQYNLNPMQYNFGIAQAYYPNLGSLSSATDAQIEEAYKSYLEMFLDAMGTDYIQYDDYPFQSAEEGIWIWTEDVPSIDKAALRNIQIVAELAKERGLEVKVVTQTCVKYDGGADGVLALRQITENDARWLNNYLLGFGVKQINYYTYWTKQASYSEGEYFANGGSFVNNDGTTTALYDFMKTIMANNTAFAPTISHFDYNASMAVGSNNNSDLNNEHISWNSSVLTTACDFRFVESVTTSLEYTLVTELYDAENYNYMYMVMNTIDPYYGGSQTVNVTFDSSVTGFYVYDQSGNRTQVTGNTYSVTLTAGQAVYLLPY